jgi:hypothetical protein
MPKQKPCYQKAVASDEKNFGEDHPTTAMLQQFGNSTTRFRRLCPSKNLVPKSSGILMKKTLEKTTRVLPHATTIWH